MRAAPRTLAALVTLLFWAVPGTALAAGDEFAQALAKGPVYAGLAAFVAGFLVSLTPCVYPMVAVTVSVFGAKSVEKRSEGVLLSGAFVLGIVAMFVPLGVAAGLTGSVMGAILQSRAVVVGLAALFAALALAMFGAFELDLPSSLKNKLAEMGGGGLWGAFVLGLVCGPIAAPCTGPFLTGILAWIAKTQSAGLGAAAMAAFALGLGVPFFVVGAFAVKLPKSGRWMNYVKSAMGIVLLVVALHFLSTTFPSLLDPLRPTRAFVGVAAAVALLGLVLGAVHRSFEEPEWTTRLSKSFGILLVTAGSFAAIEGAAKPERTLLWEHGSAEAARSRAREESRPFLVDFGASWCVACKEIDKATFSDPRVQAEAGRFVAVKVDCTHDDDPVVEATMKAFGVVGLPSVVLFDSTGAEAIRYTDFVGPEPFLSKLKEIR